MGRMRLGLLLLLVGSLAIGVLTGLVYHRVFLANVPQQWLSSFQAQTAPATFVGVGLGIGLGVFVWSLAIALIAPRFRRRDHSTQLVNHSR
jgi:hypothetical protein